jgi:hypothetical protein
MLLALPVLMVGEMFMLILKVVFMLAVTVGIMLLIGALQNRKQVWI